MKTYLIVLLSKVCLANEKVKCEFDFNCPELCCTGGHCAKSQNCETYTFNFLIVFIVLLSVSMIFLFTIFICEILKSRKNMKEMIAKMDRVVKEETKTENKKNDVTAVNNEEIIID